MVEDDLIVNNRDSIYLQYAWYDMYMIFFRFVWFWLDY